MTRAQWLRLVLVLALIGPAAAAVEPVTLRATLQVASSNELLGRSMEQFKEEVERETKKALRVEIFDRGKLYIDDQQVAGVRADIENSQSHTATVVAPLLPVRRRLARCPRSTWCSRVRGSSSATLPTRARSSGAT